MDQWLFPVLLSLFTFTVVVGLKYFVWTLPLRRMAKGGYEDALRISRLQRERLREPSSLQAQVDLIIAQILFRQGYLESALERLRQTASPHLRGRPCGEYFALKALLLMELHRDLEQARWCLENARVYAPRLSCHALYRGHLADLQDQTLLAAEAFQQYLREQERSRFSLADLWVRDRTFRSLEAAYLLGFHALRAGNRQQAQRLLEEAAGASYPNYYSNRAREHLAALGLER